MSSHKCHPCVPRWPKPVEIGEIRRNQNSFKNIFNLHLWSIDSVDSSWYHLGLHWSYMVKTSINIVCFPLVCWSGVACHCAGLRLATRQPHCGTWPSAISSQHQDIRRTCEVLFAKTVTECNWPTHPLQSYSCLYLACDKEMWIKNKCSGVPCLNELNEIQWRHDQKTTKRHNRNKVNHSETSISIHFYQFCLLGSMFADLRVSLQQAASFWPGTPTPGGGGSYRIVYIVWSGSKNHLDVCNMFVQFVYVCHIPL